MDMSAYFLTRFRGSKDPNDRNLRSCFLLHDCSASGQVRIEISAFSLIVVDTIKSDAEEVH